MTLRWSQLGDNANVVVRLLAISSHITWGLTTLLGHYLLGFGWQPAALLGAILMVTGPTVVGPLLRQIRPNRRVSSILQWEGILIDPRGAVAAVLVFEAVSQGEGVLWPEVPSIVLQTLAIGTLLGSGAAVLLVVALRKYWIPDFLHGVILLAIDAEKRLKVRTTQGGFQPKPGDRVIALLSAADVSPDNSAGS